MATTNPTDDKIIKKTPFLPPLLRYPSIDLSEEKAKILLKKGIMNPTVIGSSVDMNQTIWVYTVTARKDGFSERSIRYTKVQNGVGWEQSDDFTVNYRGYSSSD